MKRLLLIGAGDFGRLLARQLAGSHEVVGYVDDRRSGEVDGRPVLGPLDRIAELHDRGAFDAAVVAIGYHHLAFRSELCERLAGEGVPLASWIHPSSHVSESSGLGAGVLVFPGCTVDCGARLEDGVVLQVGCIVAHDTRVGAHSFLAPGVKLAGFVDVGPQSFLGIGTVVIDGLALGPRTRTGGGAVVTSPCPGDALLVGVPARIVPKR